MSFCTSKSLRNLTGVAVATAVLFVGSVALATERNLAGIPLGARASTVLKKFGNPTRITVGTVSTTIASSTQPGVQGMPPAPLGGTGGPTGETFNPFAGNPYGTPPAGGLPSVGGMQAPGQPGVPGQPEGQTITQQEITWTYEFTKGAASGDTVEFIISEDGIVTQITVGGAVAWLGSKTAQGVKLGDDYKRVLFKYGYPEGHAFVGKFMRTSFVDKHHCMFTFLDRKVVGITIALPE